MSGDKRYLHGAYACLFALALLLLEGAILIKLGLSTNGAILPTWFLTNLANLKDIGLAVTAIGAVLFGALIGNVDRQPKVIKFTVGMMGIIVLMSGVNIIVTGQLMSYSTIVGLVFGLIGLNYALVFLNKRLV